MEQNLKRVVKVEEIFKGKVRESLDVEFKLINAQSIDEVLDAVWEQYVIDGVVNIDNLNKDVHKFWKIGKVLRVLQFELGKLKKLEK